MSPSKTPRRERPTTEAPTLIVQGEPFTTRYGEAAVYQLEGYGPRIIATRRNAAGILQVPQVKTCVHRRPLRPAAKRFGGVDFGDREGYAQVCRLCAFEVDQLQRKETP